MSDATDYLLQAAIGALSGFDRAYEPYQKAKFQDQLATNRKTQDIGMEEASAIRRKKAELALEEPYNISKSQRETAGKVEVARNTPNYVLDAQGNLIQTMGGGKVTKLGNPAVSEEDKAASKLKAKLAAEKPKVSGSLSNALREYDNMINEADSIKNDPSLGTATGITSFMGNVPGTGSKRVSARIETLKSKTLLNVLSAMKQLSTTGASGFGQLSDTEGRAITSSISSLDKNLGTKDFKASLDRFVDEMRARKENLKSTYENTYGEAFPEGGKSNGLPSITPKSRSGKTSSGLSYTVEP